MINDIQTSPSNLKPEVEKNLKYPDTFDELLNESKEFRTGYETIYPYFQSMSLEKLKSIRKRIDFVLREQGITFGGSQTNGGAEKTWMIDMIPHVITNDEFLKIELGLKQRLTALNLFLKDIYSRQQILKDKVIPVDIIFNDSNYLRECVNLSVPRDVYLHIGAFDLLRDKNGDFIILDDNITIPSGISYSLLNRQVLRQQFPNLFNKMQIRQIWDTASTILSRLRECAPLSVENPKIVLLSPGIFNEAYSEHELLAKRMGIPLVLPKDLLVKENFVYMKTITGLSRVDVIYRRIEDYYLDPVSFFQDSVLGVPGILSSVRHGNVTIANAIGSGVASSKALLPYMNQIMKYYMNEEPIIKTAPTTLMSKEKERLHIFENIEKYVIKPIQGTGGVGMVIGSEATPAEIENMKAKVSQNPSNFIAQPLITLSNSQIFTNDTLESRYVETRFFTFLGSKFSLSNSALTRVSAKKTSILVTNSRGGGSKDTWIMGKSEVTASRFQINSVNNRSKNFILSRVAESLFWLGRYINRALTTANVLQVAYTSEIDVLLGKEESSYNTLISSISHLTGSPLRRHMRQNESWQMGLFNHAVMDQKNPGSMRSNLNYAMMNAREIQSMLSGEMWISLKKLLEYLGNLRTGQDMHIEDLSEWLTGVAHYSQSFYGATLDTFSRQEVLQFAQLGRLVEHCNSIVIVLKSTIQYMVRANSREDVYNNLQPFLIVMLKFLNSYEAYQWTYESRFDPYLSYRMLVVDRDFSNSLVSCLERIKSILNAVSVDRTYKDGSPEYVCDMLISRAYSFDLKGKLAFAEEKKNDLQTRGVQFFASQKGEITPGFWAQDLKAGVELLGSQIMDRYSNVSSPTPFTVVG
jgi:uncharacterized circularly permuted ATP-grasp superfamily protein/uncharacterized alpha-E superfamily protein